MYVVNNGGRAVTRDNHIRPDTSLEKLAQLRPVFDRHYGTVTAGNSSPLTDGAASVLLMSADRAQTLGLKQQALVRSYAYAAVDPAGQLLLGPAWAIPRALDRAGLTLGDIELIEINEAFACQALACIKLLGADPERVNVCGGSVALGHPLGASGARISTTLIHAMTRRQARYGLATMCIGGGQGIATIYERV